MMFGKRRTTFEIIIPHGGRFPDGEKLVRTNESSQAEVYLVTAVDAVTQSA